VTRSVRKHCVNCGDSFRGAGELCDDCVPVEVAETRPLPPHLHRCIKCGEPVPISDDYCATCLAGEQARGVRVDRRPATAHAAAICPWCRQELAWESLARIERRLPDNVVESLYYCNRCRAILEFANYIEEKGTSTRSS
jgi:uncharacterized protein with PIN domain